MNTSDVSRLVERAFRSGRDAGYKQALKEFQAEIEARMQQTENRAPAPGDGGSAGHAVPNDNGTAEHANPAAEPKLPPALAHALELVHEIPGITAWQASVKLNNNQSALYKLAKRGLVEKRGSQFYPLP